MLLTWLLSACSMPTAQPAEAPEQFTQPPSSTPTPTETIQWFPPSATPTPRPTRTAIPTTDWRPGVGAAILIDDFSSQESWQSGQRESGNIAFGSQQLNLAVSAARGYLYSLRSEPSLGDFYLEITASPNLCRGEDTYGLILRASDAFSYYRYAVNCSGMVRLEQVRAGSASVLYDWVLSGQVPIGAPARVRLGVWAYGDELRLFVGDVYQLSATRLGMLEGNIGVFARSEGSSALSVSFSDLVVYTLAAAPPTATPTTATSPTAATLPTR